MATFANKLKRNSTNIFKGLLLAAAIGSAGAASAGVLNFEQPQDSPALIDSTQTIFGKYWIETYNGLADGVGLTGLIVDGSDNGICLIQCPINNSSNYLAMLDDSYFYFGMSDDSRMRVKSLQASFMGNGQATFPATSGYLVLAGFNAAGVTLGSIQLALAGPTNSQFNFRNYDLGAFGNLDVSFVRVLGYACDTAGSCLRTTGLANFAIDNIVTVDVPEPASLALFGLAAAGLVAARRRRAA